MVKIELVRHAEHKGDLVALQNAAFPSPMSPELWQWRYLENPLAQPDPECVVAVDGDRIVGARPFMPFQVQNHALTVNTACLSDATMHPAYQGQGVWWRMNMFAIEYLRDRGYALLTAFPGPLTTRGNLKQGFRQVLPTETLFRPIQAQKLLASRLHNRLAALTLGFLYDRVTPKRELPYPTVFSQVRSYDRCPPEVGELSALTPRNGIELARSEAYLRWLFDSHPERRHRYFLGWDEGKLCAYAVTALEEQRGATYGHVVDWLVRDRDPDYLVGIFAECLRDLLDRGADVLCCLVAGQPVLRRELIRRFGFEGVAKFPYNRFTTTGRFFVLGLDADICDRLNVYDPAAWNFTYAQFA